MRDDHHDTVIGLDWRNMFGRLEYLNSRDVEEYEAYLAAVSAVLYRAAL